jgi:hypothetical protein
MIARTEIFQALIICQPPHNGGQEADLISTLQPPAAGQKRVKEGWENLYYYGFGGAMGFAALVLIYRPDTSYVKLPLFDRAGGLCSGPWRDEREEIGK